MKIAANGTKTTAAGGGLVSTCPPVDGVLASTLDIQAADVAIHPTTGDLYYSDERCNRVRRVHDGLVTSVTTVAGLEPGPLAFTADGTLYVADSTRGQVRKVVAPGNVPIVAGGSRTRLRRRRRPRHVGPARVGHRPRDRHRRATSTSPTRTTCGCAG